MLRILLTLCLVTWIIPLKVTSAQNLGEQPFINYEQFHKVKEIVNDEHSVVVTQKPVKRFQSIKIEKVGLSIGRNYSTEEVQDLIKDYSAEYGIDPETPLCIARHESGFNPASKNKSSSASGVFQYLNGTWRSTDEGRSGLSVFDADANVKSAVKYMASRKNTNPWQVKNKCPSINTLK